VFSYVAKASEPAAAVVYQEERQIVAAAHSSVSTISCKTADISGDAL
jgi:hypothetical protein